MLILDATAITTLHHEGLMQMLGAQMLASKFDDQRSPRHLAVVLISALHKWSSLLPLRFAIGSSASRIRTILEVAADQGIETISILTMSLAQASDKARIARRLEVYLRPIARACDYDLTVSTDETSIGLHGAPPRRLNVFVSFDGRQQIVNAIQAAYRHHGRTGLSATEVRSYLTTATVSDVDLLVRTDSSAQLCDFLLWQAAHCEHYYRSEQTRFSAIWIHEAIQNYMRRTRRLGA